MMPALANEPREKQFQVTARAIRDGRWVEGELVLWVNDTGDVHVHSFIPQRVIPENTCPPRPETWGEKAIRERQYIQIPGEK